MKSEKQSKEQCQKELGERLDIDLEATLLWPTQTLPEVCCTNPLGSSQSNQVDSVRLSVTIYDLCRKELLIWALMPCVHHLALLNNFIFEIVLCK